MKRKPPGLTDGVLVDGATLRLQAEARARMSATKLQATLENLEPGEIRQMVHDLHVHQIELELQNEELRRTQAELSASQARYFDLYDLAPVGYLTLGEEGLIQEANLTAARLLGKTRGRLIRKRLSQFIHPPDQPVFYQHRKRLFESGQPQACELRLVPRGGGEIWARLEANLAHDSDGHPLCRIVVHDISESKQAEQALRLSEEKFFNLHANIRDAIASVDMSGRILECNQAFCEMVGYTVDELCRMTYMDLTVARWHAMESRLVAEQVLTRGYSEFYEKEYCRKDGSIVPVELRTHLVRDDAGNPSSMWAIVRDITERKQTEEALRASEEKYRTLHESMMDAYVRVDMSGRILESNRAYQEMLGYAHEDLCAMTYVDLTPSRWHDVESRIVDEQILVRGCSDIYEKEYRRKDGTIIPVELCVYLIRGADGVPTSMWAIVRDITERRKAERELRESTEVLGLFIRHSPIYSYVMLVEPTGNRVLQVSDNYQQMLERPLTEIIGKTVKDLFPADIAARMDAMNLQVVTRGETLRSEEEYNGHVYTVIKFPICQGSRSLVGGYTIDITELRKAELTLREWNKNLEYRVAERTKELQQSHVRFHQLAEATFEGIAISEAGILVDGNSQLGKIHGCELADMIGRPVADFIAPESRALVASHIRAGRESRYEYTALRTDGSTFPAKIHARMGPWMGKARRISAVRDLSDTKAAEAQILAQQIELEHAHRLSLVSEISAGIIHQIGQPLCVMGLNATVAMSKLQGCPTMTCGAMEIIKDLSEVVVWTRDAVNHLRTLVRPEFRLARLPIQFNDWLAEVLRPVQQEALSRGVMLAVEFGQNLPPVMADAVQLNQMLLILVRNAFDACEDFAPDRRVVTIATRARDDGNLEMCVRDAGAGIAPTVIEHLFAPFFTTKAEGMGIGLRLSRTIVHAHGGSIEGSNNEDGIGATFRVVLPGYRETERLNLD